MAERDDDSRKEPWPSEPEAVEEDERARRGASERHLRAASEFFEAAPPFRVQFELDGTVSLCRKHYDYWPNRPPADATRWKRISIHQSLEQAEQRLRHITSPHVYYDDRGRLAQAPAAGEEELRRPTAPDLPG